MGVSWCHRRDLLYWNHEPCSFEFCPIVAETPGRCSSCRHHQEDICGLTRAPVPKPSGCCHWNVALTTGPQLVTPEMMAPLGLTREPPAEILDSLDAPYRIDAQGQLWVEPEQLNLPEIYGLGPEELFVEAFDWQAWEQTWQEADDA